MPPIVASLTATLIAAGVGAITAGIIASVVVSLATSIILSPLLSALQGKPKAKGGNVVDLQDRNIMIKQAITPWQLVFGTVRASGAITFMTSYASVTPSSAQDSTTNVNFPQYSNNATNPPQGYFNLVTNTPGYQYTLYFNLADGGNYVTVTAANITQTFFIQPTTPHFTWKFPRTNYVTGTPVFTVTMTHVTVGQQANPQTGTNNRLEMLLTMSGHEIDSFQEIYFDDELITIDAGGRAQGRWAGYATIKTSNGSLAEDQALNAYGRAQCPGLWTAAHMQYAKAKIWVTFIWNANLYSGNLPNVSSIMRGAKPYDPRTGLTVWSANPALITRYYLLLTGIINPTGDNTDDSKTIIAANICEEAVTLKDGSSEDRYTCNGTVDTSQTPQQVIPTILGSFMGKLIYTGGQWSILAGAWRTPTVSFNEDDLDGNPSTQTKISARENFNAVKGVFFNPAADWQLDDFPEVTNALYASQDGRQNFSDIQLPFTTSPSMAQRISKILLEQVRQGITVNFPAKLTALQCQAGDVILLSRTRLGWVDKPFEVLNWQFAVRGSAQSLRLGIDLTLRETASGVYDWNSGEETTIDLAPNTNLPNALIVGMPGTPVIVEQLYETRLNAVKTAAVISWVPVPDLFVPDYQLEYKQSSDAVWIVRPLLKDPQDTIYDINPGIWDFRVKAINHVGAYSEYAYTSNQTIYGLTALPDDIQDLTISTLSSLALLRWTALAIPANLDVTVGGHIEVRHTADDASLATWQGSYLINEKILGNSTQVVVPLKAGTYLVKAVDSTGHYSANAAKINVKSASLATFTSIGTIQEDPLWLGAYPNTIYHTDNGVFYDPIVGALKVAGSGTWDSIPSLDGVAGNIDAYGGVKINGAYVGNLAAFYPVEGVISYGAVTKVRLESVLECLCYNILDNIDARTGNMDTWPNMDGSGAAPGSIVLAIATSDDGLTYNAWQPFITGDYEFMAAQFLLLIYNTDPSYNIYITKCRINQLTATM